MDLIKLALPENKTKQLVKAGFSSVEDLYTTYPKRYRDRTRVTGIRSNSEESVVSVIMTSINTIDIGYNRPQMVKAVCYERDTGEIIHIVWFNQSYRYQQYKDLCNTRMILVGSFTLMPPAYGNPELFQCSNPAVFEPEDRCPLRIYPEYKKVPGMSETFFADCVKKASYLLGDPAETLPEHIRRKYNLTSTRTMVRELHWPTTSDALNEAIHRRLWDDLIYFALRIELNYLGVSRGSAFSVSSLRITNALRNSLPYQLTADQESCFNECLRLVQDGRRLNALVQGDVGCGKTIIATLLMTCFAENGYQAALMAPTQILAQQHYNSIKSMLEPYGIKVALVSGQKLRKKEQSALEQGIKDGEYQIVIGTQALLSPTYQFKNLALVVEDEEHKYGVLQKQALTEKACSGTHMVTMTATPIPRTLAQTLYGDNVQLFSIKTKPAGRLPVKTGIQVDIKRIFRFLENEVLTKGSQAYVVCPMVSPSDKVEGVATAEETYELYKNALERPYGIKVGLVTGKTKKAEAQQILEDFEQNRISVLVSTTVIEVGVNVPNSNTIVIHNAERFGLAQLHQLRGRVGRGQEQGWCVMVSHDIHNPRLKAMCEHADGFEISEMDLNLRGAGDLIGNQQSGTERYLALALQQPEIYRHAQEIAKELLRTGVECPLADWALEDHKNQVGGDI